MLKRSGAIKPSFMFAKDRSSAPWNNQCDLGNNEMFYVLMVVSVQIL